MKAIIFTMMVGFLSLFCLNALAGDFTDNGNGTVTDNVTGLMWQQEDDDTERYWNEAITYAEDLSFAGYTDWRLPNIKELKSIVDYNVYNPSIDVTSFPNTNSSSYWSSTTDADNTSYAWDVNFSNGSAYDSLKSYSHYVRCVRGGQ